jgi:hypothetical protein
MKNSKIKLKNLIFVICSALMSVGLAFSSIPKNMSASFAASPVSYLSTSIQSQTNTVLIDNAVETTSSGVASKTIYLYSSKSDLANFDYYVSNDSGLEADDSRLFHKITSPTKVSKGNGQFLTTIDLSKNMQLALGSGYVNLSASADICSPDCGYIKVGIKYYDKEDTVTFDLYAYNEQSGTSASKSDSVTTFDSTSKELSFSSSELSGKDYSKITLSFTSELGGSGVYNSLEVKNPVLIVSTSDVTAPSIEVSSNSTDWAQSRTLTISSQDEQSGIFKIEYRKDGGSWQTIQNYADSLEYKTSYDGELAISENGTYDFRVTDNVGNTYETSYTESNIDTVAPSVEVEILSEYTGVQFAFSANLISNNLSPDNFYYTYTFNGVTSDKIELVSGQNNFVGQESGNYVFDFYAIDKAGNEMTSFTKSVVLKENRTLVELEIEDEYIYSTSGTSLSYTKSVDGEYDIEFHIYSAGKEISAEQMKNVGTYLVTYKISNASFYGKGEKEITISPKSVTVASIKTSYVYSGSEITPEYTLSESIFSKIEIFKNTEKTAFLNAGTYQYTISSLDENYSLSETGSIEILPYKVQVQINKNKFGYDGTTKAIDYTLDKSDLGEVVEYFYQEKSVTPIGAGVYGVVISISNNSNYELNYTTSFEIEKRQITVSVNSKTAVYGNDIPTFDYSIQNKLESENLLFVLVCNYENKVGKYNIEFGQTIDETTINALSNYNVTYQNGTFEITKRDLTVTPTEKQSKIYGNSDKVLTYIASNLVEGDELSGSLTREQGEDVGYYSITVGTLENENYNITVLPASFQIVSRLAFVSIANSTKIYGDKDPEFSIVFESSNILESDQATFSSKVKRELGESVGTYVVSFDKTDIKNYTIISDTATFEILPKTISVVADEIHTNFGETATLTYVASGLVDGDELSGSLSREDGENVGIYKINLGTLSNSNYLIEFVSANLVISKKTLTISAVSQTKVYGENDDLKFEISDSNEQLNLTLLREEGEDVGSYQILGYEFDDPNYEIVFVSGVLEILPAKVNVSIFSSNKVYGEADPELNCLISGVIDGDVVSVKLARENGETAGNYRIYVSELDSKNYVLGNVNEGIFEIKKADLTLKLEDKSVTYSGNVVYIDEIDSEFDFVYTYTFAGSVVSAPTNAGEYKVQATFAGNENYNAYVTNVAKLTINKKLIPITLKETKFIYTGKEQSPTFDINLDEEISVVIKFENDLIPIEIGDYNFSVESNDSNYYADFNGTLSVVSEFYVSSSTGDASVSSTNVNINDSGICIYENTSSSLMKKFNAFRDGRRCISAYTISSKDIGASNGEVFTISIRANAKNDVKIYTIDEDGNMTSVAYTYSNGCYVLALNDLSGNILVTEADTLMTYAKIILTVVVVLLSYIITKIVFKVHKNKFYKRNTIIHEVNSDEFKNNTEIVISRVNFDGTMTSEEFLNEKNE